MWAEAWATLPTPNRRLWGGGNLTAFTLFLLGRFGVPLFIFISGYYGMHFRSERLKDILIQVALYVIAFYYVSCLFLHTFNPHLAIYQLFGITNVWFVCYYVVLYVISDGINAVLDSFSKRTFTFVVLLLLYIAVGKWLVRENALTLFLMVEYYVIARYVRKYGSPYTRLIKWAGVPALLIYLAIQYVGYRTGHYETINPFMRSYYNPFLLVVAMSAVVAADGWKTSFPAINYAAGSVLAVYMLHENAYAPALLNPLFDFQHFSIVRALLLVLVIFVVCVAIDKIRLRATNKIKKPI
jgi:hypothetical protein